APAGGCGGLEAPARRPVGQLVPRRPPPARRVARPGARLRLLLHARQLEPRTPSSCRDACPLPRVRVRRGVPAPPPLRAARAPGRARIRRLARRRARGDPAHARRGGDRGLGVRPGSADGLGARAREPLADAPARRSLAAAARERALREHTWRHRMEELLTVTLR